MTTRVNYMGTSNIRFISRANILALGLSDPLVDLVWNRQNSYERDVPDDIALYLLTQGDFASDPALNFGPLLASITPGVELLSVEYSATDQTGLTGTSAIDVTGLTGMMPPTLGNRPVEITVSIGKLRLTAGGAPPYSCVFLLWEGAVAIRGMQPAAAPGIGTVSGTMTPPQFKCRRTAAQAAGKVYKVTWQASVAGSTWSILGTNISNMVTFKAA